VAVVGAGNTAMDAARTARRLGADEAMIIFFSDRAHMEAHPFEAAEAQSEGVTIRWLSSVRDIGEGEIQVERMALDAHGVPQATGQYETLKADDVVLAVGQQADSGFLRKLPGVALAPDGTVQVGANMMTGEPGVFAGGDLVPGERSVTTAVGHGRRAARHIAEWLNRKPRADGKAPVAIPAEAPVRAAVSLAMLNLPIYADAPPSVEAEAAVAARMGSFDEIISGLNETAAQHEARRCLSCGNCFECDHCYAACPEQSISQQGPGKGYRIDLATCTGCAVCVEQCPCHAMEMRPEPVWDSPIRQALTKEVA